MYGQYRHPAHCIIVITSLSSTFCCFFANFSTLLISNRRSNLFYLFLTVEINSHLHKFQHCHYQFYTIFFINFNGQFTTALCLMSLYVLQIYQAITNLRIVKLLRYMTSIFIFFFVVSFYFIVSIGTNMQLTWTSIYLHLLNFMLDFIAISHAFKCEVFFIVAFCSFLLDVNIK